MRLATVRTPSGTRAARVNPDETVTFLDYRCVRQMLEDPDWAAKAADADGRSLPLAEADLAPVVPSPDQIHLPMPEVSTNTDWEGELAVIIGRSVRNATPAEAAEAIAGFCVLNDVSVRDWQRRTIQFLAGKTFEATTPVGPWLTTVDETGETPSLDVETVVDGSIEQSGNTSDLVFSPVDVIGDLSKIITLDPGDIIATGTPGGVGFARHPQEFLGPASVVTVSIESLGSVSKTCVLP